MTRACLSGSVKAKDGSILTVDHVVLPVQGPFPSGMMARCQGKRGAVIMREIQRSAHEELPTVSGGHTPGRKTGQVWKKGDMQTGYCPDCGFHESVVSEGPGWPEVAT